MPKAPECRMCGELMELRIIRASHPADDLHIFRCPHCHHVVEGDRHCTEGGYAKID